MTNPYKSALDRLDALVNEARWVLTDSELDRLKPVNREVPAEIESAIRLISTELMPEDQLAADDPFAAHNLVVDWSSKPDMGLLQVMRDPTFLPFTVSQLFRKPDGSPIQLLPYQHVVLLTYFYKQMVLFLGSRGAAKTWILALYIVLKLTFHQGTEIAIVSKTLRQSKLVWSYAERLWNCSPVFRSLVGEGRNGPKAAMSEGKYVFVVGDSIAHFLPMGHDGEGLRGIRATVVASDEFGCLDYNTIVETDAGMVRIGEWAERGGHDLLRPGLPPAAPAKFFTTPPVDAYRVTTANGFAFTCSAIHQVMTQDGWKLAKDLTEEDYLEQKDEYIFPTERVRDEASGLVVDEGLGWLLGALVAEGSVGGRHNVSVTSTDPTFAERVRAALEQYCPANKATVRTRDAHTDSRGWDCKAAWVVQGGGLAFRDALERLGLARATAHDKKVPWSILRSPRPVVRAFLAGLMEGDGSAFLWGDPGKPKDRLGVAFYSVSEQLVDDVQVLLLKFGCVANKQPRASKLSDRTQWTLRLNGEYAIDLLTELNVPKWADLPARVVTPRRKSEAGVVWTRYGRGKKNAGWRANRTVGRRSKCVGHFPTREEALAALEPYRKTRYLRVRRVEKLCGQRVLYDFAIPPEQAFFGNGFVQHNSLDPEVFAVVVQGFGAVSADPVFKVGERAKADIYKRLGLWTPEQQAGLDFISRGNQSIISGTATYAMGHFFTYWQSYKAVVESGGDPNKVRKIFGGDPPPGFDHRRYAVLRMPYDILPKDYLDEATIGRAKQLATSSEFLREYCCFAPDTPVVTDLGLKPIAEVQLGDRVLTHSGRFKPVTWLFRRPYVGPVVRWRGFGHGKDVLATPDHPFWMGGDEWAPAERLEGKTVLSRFRDWSGRTEVDVREFLSDWLEYDGVIGPRTGGTKLSRETIAEIRRRPETSNAIAAEYGMTPVAICQVRAAAKKRPKGAIEPVLRLDFSLGVVLGYYASEGCPTADGRATSFALDGHVDCGLSALVDELDATITASFGLRPKRYGGENAKVCSVTINSRLVTEFLSAVCPGRAWEKRLDPAILFSNPEFARGFVRGYWNGDGHRDVDALTVSAATTSMALAGQIQTVLGSLGLPATLGYRAAGEINICGRRHATRPAFTLDLGGERAADFFRVIDGHAARQSTSRSTVVRDDRVDFAVRSATTEAYDGEVFNIEVEEDNSYSLPNATVHNCVFPRDSSGFFKRSNIERCTIGGLDLPPPEFASGIADFGVSRTGDPVRQYVYGIDPAFANDNFAVVVLELWPDHRRVVHCWTTRKAEHRAHEKRGKGVSSDFYQFAVDRLRVLFAKFPPRAVVIDAQGGGRTIEEKFREPRPGETAYYAHDDEEVLHLPGEHILHMFQFANANDVSEANWGLAKDLEARCLLFPRASGAEYALADEADRAGGYDEGGLEDVLGEIDELKNELTLIVCEPTKSNARERWDLPETGAYARKDRYSALVMANLIARRIGAAVPTSERPDAYGGAVAELAARQEELGKSGTSGPLYVMTKATDPKIRAGARGTWYAG